MKLALISGCAVVVAGALLSLVADPTKGLQDQLDNLPSARSLALPLAKKVQVDIAGLAEKPIFIMTTGTSAYKDKTLQLFGLDISPGRKAVLVSVDGAAPVWMAVGDTAGDLRLADVGTNGASFDTPIGLRVVGFNDVAPAKPVAAGSVAASVLAPTSAQPPQGG